MSTPLKLVAFDLDGTLTQHKTPIEPQNRAVLEALSQRYHLLMVGAGNAQRIFHQLGDFPIDVIGNYGMQHGSYDPESRSLRVENAAPVPCDREDILARAAELRYRCGFTHYMGGSVEFHDSGVLTFALLGTEADFRTLCREAHARGIRVILDGVFNHTGSNSRYFNADGF